MVIRGKTRGNGSQLAAYLLDQKDNEQTYLFDISGTCNVHDLKMSLLEMSFTSELTKSQKGLYHAQINPAYGEDKAMTNDDWFHAVSILETELKLTGQKRVIVMHEKKGRQHAHVVWERYDHRNGKMVSDSYSRLAQDRARKVIEKELGQCRTPDRNINKQEIKKKLTDIWKKTKSGMEFIRQACEKGYLIAKGVQRPFMVVDEAGRSFDLVRQLEKVRTKEVRNRLKDEILPTEKQAIQSVRERLSKKNIDDTQEKALDRIAEFKQKRDALTDQQKLYNDKISKMREGGEEITKVKNNNTDKYLLKAKELLEKWNKDKTKAKGY